MRRVRLALSLLAVLVATCTTSPGSTSSQAPTAAVPSSAAATASPPPSNRAPTPAATASPALIGQWELDRTCEALVQALTTAGHPEVIRIAAGELVAGNVDGQVPSDWDPDNPCAKALPPTPHSHTFWPNGRFNSYDENGDEVDDDTWAIVDDETITIGGSTFTYAVTADSLRMEPVVPAGPCSGQCQDDLAWMYSVSYPGSTWQRVTSGPHVP